MELEIYLYFGAFTLVSDPCCRKNANDLQMKFAFFWQEI